MFITISQHKYKIKQVLYCQYKLKMIVKNINIKNLTYYFFDDIINVKDFDQSNIKIDERSYKIFLFTIMDM